MKGWKMYSKIQAMKEDGFSMRQVSRVIRVTRGTIKKYWEMSPEEYAAGYKTLNRMMALMAYEPVVLKWLETYPCMTAAQVRDWLLERYKLDAAERTVRRFVLKLRKRHGITKATEARREYEAVDVMPKGYQLQLDFSEKTVREAGSRYIKLYFVVSENKGDIITQAFTAFLSETKIKTRVCRKNDPETKGLTRR